MGFATGRSSESSFKRYIGAGSFKVIAVNPNATQLSQIYEGREITTEPVYTGTATVKDKNGNDKEVQTATVQIHIQSDPAKNNGIDAKFSARITIMNTPWYSFSNGVTKAQIIDEYGRTAWATLEEIAAKKIPVYKNGKPANISANYRYAYRGEAELTEFIINFLNIPNVQTYDKNTGTWNMVAEPEKSEARLELDTVKNFFKGKFNELTEIFNLQPENHIKLAIGVRTADDGKLYQSVYTRKTLRNASTSYDPIKAEIESAKLSGSLVSTEYFLLVNGVSVLPELQEYNPVPTVFTPAPESQSSQDGDESPVPGMGDDDDLPFGE